MESSAADQFLRALAKPANRRARDLAARPGHALLMFDVFRREATLLSWEADLLDRVAAMRFQHVQGRATRLTPDVPAYKRQTLEAVAFHVLMCRRGADQTQEEMLPLIRAVLDEMRAYPDFGSEALLLDDLCQNSGFLHPTADGNLAFECIPWLQFFAARHIARQLKEPCATPWRTWAYNPDGGSMRCHTCGATVPPLRHYLWCEQGRELLLLVVGIVQDPGDLLARIHQEEDDLLGRQLAFMLRALARAHGASSELAGFYADRLRTKFKSRDEFAAWWVGRDYGGAAALAAVRASRDSHVCSASVDTFVRALGDKYGWVRSWAADALGEIGDPAAVGALVQALGDDEEDVRSGAAEALGKIGGAAASAALVWALSDAHWRVRVRAVEALGKIGDPAAVHPLARALYDKDWSVRIHAAEALENIGGTAAIEPLLHALGDKEGFVRSSVVAALGNIGGAAASEALFRTLGDEEHLVRWRAAEALGKIGGDGIIMRRDGHAEFVS